MNLKRLNKKKLSYFESRVSQFLLIAVFQLFFLNLAISQNTKEEKVNLLLKNVTLEELFLELGNTTMSNFKYADEILNDERKFTYDFSNLPLKQVLSEIALDAGLGYKFDGRDISIKKLQKLSVKGKVTDTNTNEALIGVTVSIKGTSKGTITDIYGNYSINAFPSSTLQFSFIGFKTIQEEIGGRSTINQSLEPETTGLNEIMVIGYGQQSRTKVAGAIGKIGNEELTKVAAPSIDQQLAGKMAGVVVNQANGQPGAGTQIIIRGTGTLTAGMNPLIVVDGLPLSEGSSLNAINPDDIADIDILKDAASAAIYGSRAANGVILISTKKGANNQKTTVSFDTYYGFQKQSSGVKLVDAYQHAQFLTEARNWGYASKDPSNRSENDPNSVRVTKKINGKNIDGRELFLDYLQPYLDGKPGLTNTNWMNEAFRTAPMHNYLLSFSGGNENTRYYASLGYFEQEGIVIGTDLKRYSASFKLETKVNDKINIGINIKPSYSDQNAFNQGSRSSGALALIPLNFPFYSPYKEDGSLNISEQLVNEQHEIEGVRINGTPVENLVATASKVKDNNQRYRSFGNIFLRADLFKGLSYKLSLGGDYDSYIRNYYYPSDVGSYRKPAPRSDASAQQRKKTRVNYIVENTLNYKLSIDKHSFNFLAGHTFQKERSDYTKTVGSGFPDNNIQSIAGASNSTVSSQLDIWALESYFTRLQYDFDAKYLFSAAIRRDGSSRFGVNNRWGNFPSVSAGWVFSREDFFPFTDVLTFGKLSTSWGQTGNNQIGTYGSQALVTSSNYVFGNALGPGYITTSAPNPDLGWEIASSLNIGLDLGFFNKFNLNAAYYKTNTKDLLLNVPVPQQTGYDIVLANIGEMENQGWEFQLSGSRLNIGDIRIGFNANLTTYKNKVIALGPGQNQIATGRDQNFVTKVGHSIAEIYGYKISGVFKTQEELNNTPHLDGSLTGDYIVEDVNKDGVIDTSDKVSKGTYAPDFTYGFGSDINYKGFTFSFNFTGVAGRTLMNGEMASLTEAGEGFAVPTTYYFKNRYHPVNNPDGFLGQPNFGNFSNARKLVRSSVVVEKNNGDYIRLRDVRLAYNFSKPVLEKLKLSGMQLYLSGNNLFTKTKYRGWNPDGTSSNILTSGYNTGANYPIAKSYLVGVKITY